MAGGGAAGLNILPIARELGCRLVLLPRTAGALSACGAHYSDIVAEFSASAVTLSDSFDAAAVNRALDRVRAEAEAFADGLRRRGIDRFRAEYRVEARYLFQVWDLEVTLPVERFTRPDDVAALVEAFHQAHERVHAVRDPEPAGRMPELEGAPRRRARRARWCGAEAGTASAPVAIEREFGALRPGGNAERHRSIVASICRLVRFSRDPR